jgi:hypothetical protein
MYGELDFFDNPTKDILDNCGLFLSFWTMLFADLSLPFGRVEISKVIHG